MKAFLLIVLLLIFSKCTNPSGAIKVLSDQGYINIRITGYKWFACAEGDTFATGFKAISPAGKPVSGCVCQGLLFKNSTIRFE